MSIDARLEDRSARVAVIGCGYVGLPLAVAFANAGFTVVGIDVDREKVRLLQEGRSYIRDIPDPVLAVQVDGGRFRATTDYDALRDVDIIFVSVPTPFDRAKQPDLSYVRAAAEEISKRLRQGQLVVLESTTYPGTTDEVMRPLLERSGLRAGHDFLLAFSPERIDPGNKRFGIENTPKVVGGIDAESTRVAARVLEQVITRGVVHAVSSPRAAEFTKLLENTFRAVNIALVNELAMLCHRMGIDIWEVVEAASTKPYGFLRFEPGPGVGGHCIPVDPYYLAWKAREFDFHTRFIELAAETNLAMPFFTAERIGALLDAQGRPLRGANILVLGASFKSDVEDARNSVAIRVMEILANRGAVVTYHDPYVPAIALSRDLFSDAGEKLELRSVPLAPACIAAADCVVILVRHSAVDYEEVLRRSKLVFDAVNATKGRTGAGVVERL